MENIAVINCAQPVTSLALDLYTANQELDVKMLATFIAFDAELEGFGGKVTRYRNIQNAISNYFEKATATNGVICQTLWQN